MATMEQMDSLLSAIGPVLDPLAIQASPEHKSWAVALDEELTVLIQFDEQKNCLVLASELGAPPPGDRMALYELLLQLNYHWDTTGGNRMAIDGPGGDVVQVFEISAEGLDVTRLSQAVASFAKAAKAWRGFVQRPASAQESTLDMQAFVGVRV